MKITSSPFKITFLILMFTFLRFSSSGQCLKPVELNERVDKSELIIEGLVTKEKSLWDDKHHNIYTIYTIEVTKIFKGNLTDSTVNILVAGGTIGLDREEVSNNLELAPGKAGVFMLIPSNKPVSSSNTLFEAYAGPQGFLRYDKATKKAHGIFDHYQSLENDLYNKIVNRTHTRYKQLKDIPWKRISQNNSETHKHDVSPFNNNLQQDLVDHLVDGNNLYSENVSASVSATASITSFSPSTVEGGNATVLTINGSGFGATQGTSYVEFSDANSGGSSYYSPLATQYVSWSDTKIMVEVPSRAGTGYFRVSDGTNIKTSATKLTVDYSFLNTTYDPGTGTKAYIARHQSDNGAGGYTLQCYTGFSTTATTDFSNVLNQWKCSTGINWGLGSTTSTNVDAADGINIVRFDSGSELAAGVLGQARSRFSGCVSGSIVNWYLSEIDVVFDDGTTFTYGSTVPTGTQYDFYSVALHEMGHAHQLAHVIDNTDVMHYSLSNATQRRTLATNNNTAGAYMVTLGGTATICGTSAMLNYACSPTVTLSTGTSSISETGGSTTVTATLNGVYSSAVTVNLSLSGTATTTTDYTLSTSITIPAGSLSTSITLSSVGDTKYEGNETVIIDISSVTNATESGTQQQTVTITDDDSAPTVTLSTGATSISETGGSTTVTATLSAVSGLATTVTLSLSGTATVTSDYTLSTTITIPAGSTSASNTLASVSDAVYEGNETVIIDISAVTNGTESGTQQQTVTITDDDAAPTVTLSTGATSISETSGSTTVTATLSAASGVATTVTLSLSGTATVTSDYTLSTTITIPAGSTSTSITLASVNDVLYEGNETVIIDISTVTNGTESGTQQKTVTIIDDDAAPTVTLSTGTTSISETSGNTTVTATLSAASNLVTTVTLSLSGTATVTSDYTLTTTITIPAGSTSASNTLASVGDALYEGNESVIIDITAVTNGTESGTQQKTVTITDDDTAPSVTLSTGATTISETSGSTTVTATLSAASGLATTVTLSLSGTATVTSDYTLTTTITIPAGSTSSSVTLASVSDALYEGNETVIIDISTVTNGTESGTQQQTVTITDDETAPTVTLSTGTASISETAGSTTVTATLSAVSGVATTVTLSLSGTATVTTDYTLSTTITIPAGSISASNTLASVGDVLYEGNETVIIDISTVTNGTESGTQQKTVSITDDETAPTVTLTTGAASISETSGSTTITATLSAVSGLATTVTLSLSGTATVTSDYTLATTITIPAGNTSASATLASVSDALYEGNETVIIDISTVTNGTESGTQQQTMTIIDDETAPTVTIAWSNTSIGEGAAGTSNAVVTLSAASGLTTTISLAFSNTATLNTDYTVTGTVITIPAGSTSGYVTMNNIPDNLYEGNEYITVDIATVTYGTEVGTQNATMTINDDDAAPSVSLTTGATSITETSGSTTVTATLSAVSGLATTVYLSLSGTATVTNDYTLPTTITIPAGSSSGSVILASVSDTKDENDETVIIDISSATNGTESGTQQQTVTILDDDAAPIVTLSASALSINETGGTSTITANLSAVSELDVTVNLSLSGTATLTSDYTLGSIITIPAGSTTGSITLTSVSDSKDENNETVIIDIASVSNGTESGVQQQTVTILDDDAAPSITLSLGSTSISETGGTSTITVAASDISDFDITVNLGFSGTATRGTDYSVSSSVTIPAGSTTASITLSTIDDLSIEGDETVIVDITSVTNGTESGTQQKTLTIVDDDFPVFVTMSVNNTSISETGGQSIVTATLSMVPTQDVTINFGLTGTATSTTDYTMATSLTIPAGSTSGTVTLSSVSDTKDEYDETVVIDIISVTNATETGTQQQTVTILDDDAAPTVTLTTGAASINETGGTTTITASLSAISGLDVTVTIATSGTATITNDYTLGTSILIPAGSSSASITLASVSDAKDENNETVIIDITAVSNGTESGVQQKTVTILDDDAAPTVTLSTAASTVNETGGTTTVTATLSAVSELNVTVNLALSGTATVSSDYTLNTSITIPAGNTTGSITLNSVNDTKDENDETVIIDISTITNGTEAGVQQQTVTILDDDAAPSVTLSTGSSSILETGGTTTVTATLSAVSGLDVTVNISASGTATIVNDYTLTNTITITAGNSTGSITLSSVNDSKDENDETVIIDIASVTNGTESGIQQKTVTILDDDAAPTVTLTTGSASINETGGTTTVTATLSAISGLDVTVTIATSGTATIMNDYTLGTSIFIPAGSSSASITLASVSDLKDENDETVIIDITTVSNGTESGVQQKTVTILDDDDAPSVTLSTAASSINETSGTTTVTATLSAVSELNVTVNLALSGTATITSDYTLGTTISIPTGSTTGSISLNSVNDTKDENNETVIIDITSITNGTESGVQQQTVTILDDDAAPFVTLSTGSSSISEASGTTTVTATLSAVSGLDVTVSIGTSGTATLSSDYTIGTSIFIPAGSTSGTATLASIDDSKDENDETVIIDIVSITNGIESGVQQQTVTILDDDAAPSVTLSVSNSSIAENGGTTSITADLDAVSEKDVTVNLALSGSASGAGVDYTISSTSIVIPAGSTSASVSISSVDDNLDDNSETIVVTILSINNGIESVTQTQTITIIDDEAPEMDVFQGTTAIANSSNFDFGKVTNGNSSTITFTITNNGTFELNLTDANLVSISGDNASEFKVNTTSTSSVIAVGASTTFDITYTPACGVSKSATITINNDDSDENPYIINLAGQSEEFIAPVPDAATLADITAECEVTLTAPTATDNCDGTVVARTTEPLIYNEQGTYTVTWIYTDASGNSATQTQKVIISDITAPTITCPDNMTVTSASDIIVNYTNPVINDNCLGTVTSLVTGFSSGSLFPVGTNEVSYKATDKGGNTSTCSFNVTVQIPTSVTIKQDLVTAIYPNPTSGIVAIDLKEQITKIVIIDDKGVQISEIANPTLMNVVDLSAYSSGLYIIQLQSNDGVINHKITLQK